MSEHRSADEPETTQVAPYARTPADPWPHSQVTPPASPVVAPGRRPGMARWLVPVAAATAVLAVVAFLAALLWPVAGGTRGGAEALPFRSFVNVAEVDFRERSRTVFTQVAGDRAYAASVQDGALEVIAVDLTSGERLWTEYFQQTDRWSRLWALPDAVVLFGDELIDSQARPMIVLDPDTGGPQWQKSIRGDDHVWAFDQTLVVTDREAGYLLGFDYAQGPHPQWSVPFPDGGEPALRAVLTGADLAGPSTRTGGFPGPLRSNRIVMVGGDRSGSVIDTRSGEVVAEAPNVAATDDQLLAYDNLLVVATAEEGYRVEAFALDDLSGQVRTLYRSPDAARAPVLIRPCGQQGVCLLDQTNRDRETTELVALSTAPDADTALRWQEAVPDASQILPVGEAVVVRAGDSQVRAFDRDGVEQPALSGAAVRLNEANLLLFSSPPSSFQDDVSFAGYPLLPAAGEPERVELGPVADVISEGCAWDARHLACPHQEGAKFFRFVRDPSEG